MDLNPDNLNLTIPLKEYMSATDVRKFGQELVNAFKVMVKTYQEMTTNTEAERAAYVKQCETEIRKMWSTINKRLAELKDGKTPTQSELIALILPNIRDEITAMVPTRDDVQKMILAILPPPPKDGSPDTADVIRNKLEVLPEGQKLSMDAVEGLNTALEDISKRIMYAIGSSGGNAYGGGVSGRDIFTDIDISDQLDGVTTTFDIPAVYNIISVVTSSYPTALRKNIDFSYTPTTITFLGTIDPATQLSEGQQCIITAVVA